MKFISSMWSRIFVILLIAVSVTALLTWWGVSDSRQQILNEYRDIHAIDRVEQFVLALNEIPQESRTKFLQTAPRLGVRIVHTQDENIVSNIDPYQLESNSKYAVQLRQRLGKKFKVVALPPDQSDCSDQDQVPIALHQACETLGISFDDGSRIRLTVLPPPKVTGPLDRDISDYWYVFILILAIVSLLIARMSVKPLQQMAAAATALGSDINQAPLTEQGSSEIRQATRAFNAMQARIKQHVAQRTHMLSAITHDLQTPLTRMRLRVEKIDEDALREKFINDLNSMQHLIKEGLDLARSLDSNEAMQIVDLNSLLDSLCADCADAGQPVTLTAVSDVKVAVRIQGFRRCLNNLIENAIKYGTCADVSLSNDQTYAIISIRDRGPGIDEIYLEKVFEPFFRLETSRSRESGGTGLGLAIAQNLAQQQNATLTLHNLAHGGLEARLRIPLHMAI